MSKKRNDGPDNFELKLANGKSRKFKTGYDMWRWASQGTKMEFYDDSKDKQPPTLSEWFERRRPKKNQ